VDLVPDYAGLGQTGYKLYTNFVLKFNERAYKL